jgi:methyl-accepting chemotaxis protein
MDKSQLLQLIENIPGPILVMINNQFCGCNLAAAVEEITASINEVNTMIINTSKEAMAAADVSKQAVTTTKHLSKQSEEVFSVATRLTQEMQLFTVN